MTSAFASIADVTAAIASVIPPVTLATDAIALASHLASPEIPAPLKRVTVTTATATATLARLSLLPCFPVLAGHPEGDPRLNHSKQDTNARRAFSRAFRPPRQGRRSGSSSRRIPTRTVTAGRYCKVVTKITLLGYSSAIAPRPFDPAESPASQPLSGRVGCAAFSFSLPFCLPRPLAEKVRTTREPQRFHPSAIELPR